MNKFDILKHIDFLDLVRIHVYRAPPSQKDPYPVAIDFECVDKNKKIIFDESEFKRMKEILSEKAKQFHPNDPRLKNYLEEFTGRLASELYRNGLVEFEELKETEDPYKAFRN